MANKINFFSGKEGNQNSISFNPGNVLFAIGIEDGQYIGHIYYDYLDEDGKTTRVSMGSGMSGLLSNLPSLSIKDIEGHEGDSVSIANLTEATLPLPDIIYANYLAGVSLFDLTLLDDIKPNNLAANKDFIQSRLYGNSLVIIDPANYKKQNWIRTLTENNNKTTFEIAAHDSVSVDNEDNRIVARLYNADGDITKEATLLDYNGSSSFPGPIYCDTFIGDLIGNADTATNATNDESGRNIQDLYLVDIEECITDTPSIEYSIRSLSGSGAIRDVITIPNASPSQVGLITADEQIISGNKIIDLNGGLDIQGADTFRYSGITESEDDIDTSIWFSLNGEVGTPVYDNAFTYNSKTNKLMVDYISGYGCDNGVYIEGLITNAMNDDLGFQISASYVTCIAESVDATYLNDPGINFTLGGFNSLQGEITNLQIPNASPLLAGLITNSTQTLSGWKTLQGYLIFPWLETNTTLDVFAVGETKGREFLSHGAGIQGMMGDSSYVISGRTDMSGKEFLEIAVGHNGNEPIYFSQYEENGIDSKLKRVLTLMDENGGTVAQRLTITSDTSILNSDLDYGLKVDKESYLYDTVYVGKSIRLQADDPKDKTSLYYIASEEDQNCQSTKNKDRTYYAYLESLLLQDQLEVIGQIVTRDIIPDAHNEYTIGQGLPEIDTIGTDNYYKSAYIKNIYGNQFVVQGETNTQNLAMTYEAKEPRIIFRENDGNDFNNQIYLFYTNKQVTSSKTSYCTTNGLRLTGEEDRPWLDVDGVIYSRYNDSRYGYLTSEDESISLFLTLDGEISSGHMPPSILLTNSSTQPQFYMTRDNNSQYIDIHMNDTSNIINSYQEWGINKSLYGIDMSKGIITVDVQSSANSYLKLTNNADKKSFTLFNQIMNGIYNDFKMNENSSFDFESRLSTYNYLHLINNINNGYELDVSFDAYNFLNSYLKKEDFNFTVRTSSASSFNIVSKPSQTSLNLIATGSSSTSPSQIYALFNNGEALWNIILEKNNGNLYENALQFKQNDSDSTKIVFDYTRNTGIGLHGDQPYIDFFYDANAKFTSRLRTISPLTTNVNGALEFLSQVIITTDIDSKSNENPTGISSSGAGTLLIGSPSYSHLAIDNYSINAKANSSTTNTLFLNRNGGRIFLSKEYDPALIKNTNATLYVGGSGYFEDWLEIGGYLSVKGGIELGGNLSIGGNLTVTGQSTLNGETAIRSNLTIDGDIIPNSPRRYNLGSEEKVWNDVYSDNFYGYLHGTAAEAIIARKVANDLHIHLNTNDYYYNGSNPIDVQFFAPQSPAEKNMYVLYWFNGTPAWGDANWVVPEPDPEASIYVRKTGDVMTGSLTLRSTNFLGSTKGAYWYNNNNGDFTIQSYNNSYDTKLVLQSPSQSQIDGNVTLTYDSYHGGIFTISNKTAITDATGNGQLRLIEDMGHSSLYMKNYQGYTTFFISGDTTPLVNLSNDKEALSIQMSTGIVSCKYGVYGALWNDYAEFRESDELEPGRCVYEVGDDTLTRTTERLMPGCNIVSDTFGFAQGQTEMATTPIATAGRVLAYTYEKRDIFKPGDAVCSGPNGTVSLMSREEIMYYPDRIVGTISCVPTYEYWGDDNKVKVNGRVWVKVK